MRRIKYIAIFLFTILVFVFALSAHGKIKMVAPLVTIETHLHYLSESAIKKTIYGQLQENRYDDELLSRVENHIQENPWVEKANVYMTVDGNMKIHIEERIPTLRVFTTWQSSFYIDKHLNKMPAQLVENALTSILLRYPLSQIDTPLLNCINQWVKGIQKNEVLSQYFSHFNYINNQEIEIVPIHGSPVAIVPIAEAPEKISKQLAHFYENILPQVGWDYYRSINFTFKNQVIANKNI